MLLNPDARVSANKTTELAFAANFMMQSEKTLAASRASETQKMMEVLAEKVTNKNSRVGVDVEDINAINVDNETFLERNFTTNEIAYCQKAPSPQSSFAGKWTAKEAVFKSLGVSSKGAGAAMKDIEINKDENGAPVVAVSFFFLLSRSFSSWCWCWCWCCYYCCCSCLPVFDTDTNTFCFPAPGRCCRCRQAGGRQGHFLVHFALGQPSGGCGCGQLLMKRERSVCICDCAGMQM